MNDRTTLALTETLRQHDSDVAGDLDAAPVIVAAKRTRRRRRVAAAAGSAATVAVLAVVVASVLPGRPTATQVPATRTTTPSITTTAAQGSVEAWVETLPHTAIPEGSDTIPAASIEGNQLVLRHAGRSVVVPDGIVSLSRPRPVAGGWLFVGLTRPTSGGVLQGTTVVRLEAATMTVRVLAHGSLVDALIVAPDAKSFAWVDLGTTEPGAAPDEQIHVTDLASGHDTLTKAYDELKIGSPATWTGTTITFVRTQIVPEGAYPLKDVETPITSLDLKTSAWAAGGKKRQFDGLSVMAQLGHDTTALVNAKELGGEHTCVYRMAASSVEGETPVACNAAAKISPGGHFVLLVNLADVTKGHRVLDGTTFAEVLVPEELVSTLIQCTWQTESTLFCPTESDGHAFLWSMTQGVGQRVDPPARQADDETSMVGRILTE